MYQVIKAALKDSEDSTTMSLLYANQTEADILLQKELDELAAAHPDRFKVRQAWVWELVGKECCVTI